MLSSTVNAYEYILEFHSSVWRDWMNRAHMISVRDVYVVVICVQSTHTHACNQIIPTRL